MPARRAFLTMAAALTGIASLPGGLSAAPASRLIAGPWQQTGGGDGPDHAAWAAVLSNHWRLGQDGIARIDYAAIKADIAPLRTYVAMLEGTDPRSLNAAAQMAFWINLYNALTVRLVAEAWPVRSIRSVKGGLFGLGPWDETLLSVAGRGLSLDDIEHGILRPIFRDPRIHYAVNCAALGCPNLAGRPFTAQALEAMLEANATAFINHPRGVRVADGRLTVSSIFHWFKEDFGGTDAGVIAHLQRYAAAPLAAALAGRSRIDDHAYDWDVNAA
ncbi:MAG: DUF547 domain-containing protein [Pseudomonadota bacterium]